MLAERDASTPAWFACTEGALPAARSSAALNVMGSANASEGMAEANNAVEIRNRMVLPRFNMGMPDDCQPVGRVRIKHPSGEITTGESTGDGPVEAVFAAILKATGAEAELREYHVGAVTGGEDALGQVTVVLKNEHGNTSGQGVSTDIIEASARAYVRALGNLLDGSSIRQAEEATSEAVKDHAP